MASDPMVTANDTSFPVQILRLDRLGLSLAAARNAAAQAASGSRLTFLDVEYIPMRNLVGAMARCLVDRDALLCAEVRYLALGGAQGAWERLTS